jgi:hypothetical protein
MESQDIERELFELARDWMPQSKLKILPGHQSRSTDASLGKQYREYKEKKKSVLIQLFRCQLHRGCRAGIRILEGPDRCGEDNANSHDEDSAKYLKQDQIVAVADAVTLVGRSTPAQHAACRKPNQAYRAAPPPLYAACCTRFDSEGAVDCQATGRLQYR